MDIDLFTLAAQIVNFVILIFLLNHFLFKRVQAAMKSREKTISDNLAAAEQKRLEATEIAQKTAAVYKEIENRKDELLTQAGNGAEETRKELEAAVRGEAQAARKEWQTDLLSLKDNFLRELRIKSGDFVCRTAEKALKDLANENLNSRIAEVFITRIKEYDDVKAAGFSGRLKKNGQLTVKTAFAISPELEENIIDAIRKKFSFDGKVLFELTPAVTCGITLMMEDYKISWSVEDYLVDLEKELTEAFEPGKS